MATDIVESLKELVANLGKPIVGLEKMGKKACNDFKALLNQTLEPVGFVVMSREGNPLTNLSPKYKQTIKNRIWFVGVEKSTKQPAVTLSGFLY